MREREENFQLARVNSIFIFVFTAAFLSNFFLFFKVDQSSVLVPFSNENNNQVLSADRKKYYFPAGCTNIELAGEEEISKTTLYIFFSVYLCFSLLMIILFTKNTKPIPACLLQRLNKKHSYTQFKKKNLFSNSCTSQRTRKTTPDLIIFWCAKLRVGGRAVYPVICGKLHLN